MSKIVKNLSSQDRVIYRHTRGVSGSSNNPPLTSYSLTREQAEAGESRWCDNLPYYRSADALGSTVEEVRVPAGLMSVIRIAASKKGCIHRELADGFGGGRGPKAPSSVREMLVAMHLAEWRQLWSKKDCSTVNILVLTDLGLQLAASAE